MPKAEQEIDFLACRRKEEELFLFCIWMKIAIENKKANYGQDTSVHRLSL